MLWYSLALAISVVVLIIAIGQDIQYLEYIGLGAFFFSLVSLSRALKARRRNR